LLSCQPDLNFLCAETNRQDDRVPASLTTENEPKPPSDVHDSSRKQGRYSYRGHYRKTVFVDGAWTVSAKETRSSVARWWRQQVTWHVFVVTWRRASQLRAVRAADIIGRPWYKSIDAPNIRCLVVSIGRRSV